MIKLFKRNKEVEYLSQSNIEKLGFKETLTKGHLMYFKKGNMLIKWDFHIDHRIVTIKWGKSMRFFGIVETDKELERIMININKYFGSKK